MSRDTDATPTLHVVDLTDEELVGIDGPDATHVAPLPWLGSRPRPEVELAAEVGLRSLVAHGRAGAAGGTLHLPDDVAGLLDLRHEATTLVYAEHSTAEAQETRVLYVHPHAVLTEEVNASGVHRFSVGGIDAALADLAAWAVPAAGVPTDHDPGADDDLPDALAGLRSVVCLDVVRLEGEDVDTRSVTFYRLADGTTVEGDETKDSLDLRPCPAEEIQQRVGDVVRGA